jgi:hypothetical protein
MKKKQSEPRAREATRGDAKPAREQKARDQAETDAIARAVLEALSAHDL